MPRKKAPQPKPKKTCSGCGKEKPSDGFYKTKNPYFADGVSPVCKNCLTYEIDPEDINTIYKQLEFLDKPFLKDLWEGCFNGSGEQDVFKTFSVYMRQVNGLSQYKDLTFKHSSFYDSDFKANKYSNKNTNAKNNEGNKTTAKDTGIKITKAVKERWGDGYSNDEYRKLEKFYSELKQANEITTPQHRKIVEQLVKLSLKMDQALDSGDSQTYKKYADAYKDLIASAGLRPIDKSGKDTATGMKTFSAITEAVESRGFIKPKPIEENQDIVDAVIYYILNYKLKLLNMSQLAEAPEDTPKVEDYLDKDAKEEYEDMEIEIKSSSRESS